MSDFTVVEPKGWEYDLQSVYSAWMGFFQHHGVPWYDRTWGHLFSSFEEFLVFSWPVITVTDSWTGRAHIVTRLSSINAFLKMVKTRFGETLTIPPNIIRIAPYETSSRPLRNIADYASYRKLHQTLAATHLTALKSRVRACEAGIGIKTIADLWAKRDKTFLALDFEWSERNKTVLEWGYAAVRCSHLAAQECWPPVPDKNYMKGHYIVAEHVDKIVNKHSPTHPWLYAFGESQVVSKNHTTHTLYSRVNSSFTSPDSEATPNNLVLVGHGIHGDLAKLEELKIKLPHNMFVIDTALYERTLYHSGKRPAMSDPATGRPRAEGSTLSLENLLHSLAIPLPATPSIPAVTGKLSPKRSSPVESPSGAPNLSNGHSSPIPPVMRPLIPPGCVLNNSGNDAFMCLVALQMLLEPEGLAPPSVKTGRIGRPGGPGIAPTGFMAMPITIAPMPFIAPPMLFPTYSDARPHTATPAMQMSMSLPFTRAASQYFGPHPVTGGGSPLVNELGQMRLGLGNDISRDSSRSPRPRTASTPLSSARDPSKVTGVGPRYPGSSLMPDVNKAARNSYAGL
ncbi:hypothetical protein PLEOSDRAFT_1110239 [Pleurotus ostreatus PC15]|uniref:Gfd2/YDR514C-like C-terminal domain-containing protein n=1 Tax=Pleurotus ostreatus (strain PC15) TaxID=1137138 RepID=A0A067P9Z8_PLEO1|nr:hypothetical protein PLEOSDRAFT_1110239 [Pleurotus ostreatus PC15]